RFDRSAQEIQDKVRLRIATSIALLRAGTGLFAASDSVQPNEFKEFVRQIELDKNYKGVLGIGFARRFSEAEKERIVILYLEPANAPNKSAINFDMAREPVRRRAMEAARDSGNPTASGKVELVQERDLASKQNGFLIYAPVYRNGAQLNTIEQRREALLGFVYSPFRIDDFLAPVTEEKNYDVSFQVYDGESPQNLLSAAWTDVSSDPLFHDIKKLDIAEHTWTIAYATKPSFEKYSGRSLLKYTLILGGLLSFLFFAVTRSEIRARTRAERATEEVKESEATLQQTAEALRDANQRAVLEYERLIERIKALAQALGTARELSAIYRALREFTNASIPCNGFFVSLYDPVRDVRTCCYGWADGTELDIAELPPMPVTTTGPNSRAVRTGEVIITTDYMRATQGGVVVGPDNGLRPDSSMAVPMAVMGRIIGSIEVQSYEHDVYRPEHATAMSMAANLTAVAIENVRLLKLE
ncbi:MAG TPA: CHASE domain-containing protein, partial [Pyrinomonadaceae bacterium]|nr:CHASE domain-containing protein [Pyrinomonadaceae bacterium]